MALLLGRQLYDEEYGEQRADGKRDLRVLLGNKFVRLQQIADMKDAFKTNTIQQDYR